MKIQVKHELDNTLEQISHDFMNQNFQKFCGLELLSVTHGFCLTSLCVSENIGNAKNRLHSGALYSSLDITAFIASLSVIEESEYPVTHNMNVSILSSAQQGEEVYFKAQINRKGKNIIFIDVIAYVKSPCGIDKIIAHAMITKSILTNVH